MGQGENIPPEPPGGEAKPEAVPEIFAESSQQTTQQPTQVQASTFILEEEEGPISRLKKFLPFIIIILVLAILAFFVFKIFFHKVKPPEINLTYWGLWEPENTMSEVISDYQKIHPNVKISYSFQSKKDYRERLVSAIAQGKGPDIFRFHNTWVPMLKNDLDSVPAKIMDAASFEATFYPVARNDLRVSSSYVGIPLEIDGLGLFVNEEIFEAGGKTNPTTWDELRKTAIELTTRDTNGKIQIAGVALGRTENVDHWSDILGLMMLQNGADPAKPTECILVAGEEQCYGIDALKYFTTFSKVDGVWDETLPGSMTAFTGGKLAMYFGPSWAVFEIKAVNPRLKFKVLPVPQLEDTDITWGSYWVEGVSKKSKNQEAAWDFLKYLSESQTMQKLFQAESRIRHFGEPYSRVDMADQLKNDDYAGAYIKQAPVARSWYLSSRTYDNGINDKIIKYFEDAVNAVNLGKTEKEALETAASGVAQVLAQYGVSASVVPR